MVSNVSFRYEVEQSEIHPSEDLDSRGREVTTFKCHGRIVAENRSLVEEMVKSNSFKGRIVIDLADVDYVDSAGLGALMRVKLSAVTKGGVSVKLVHVTPRVMQLLKLSNLVEWFSS